MGDYRGRYIRIQSGIAACLNIGIMMGGYTISWTTVAVPKLQDPKENPLPETISLRLASWITAGYLVGAITGPFAMTPVSNKFGRKPCFIIGGTLALIGTIITTLAKSIIIIFVGRFIWGLGQGAVVIISIVYLGEIASPNIRGFILSSTGFFHCFGCLLAYCTGPFVPYAGIGYIYMSIVVCYLLFILFVPESPLYFILKGDEEAATNVFQKFGRAHNSAEEIENINSIILGKHKESENWKKMFTDKKNKKCLAIILVLFVLQESSGIFAIVFFVTSIFQKAGSSVAPHIATIIVGATQMITTVTAPICMDRIGRRISLLISSAGCFICTALLGAYFYLEDIKHPLVDSLGWLPLVLMMVLYCAFNIGLNIVPNTLAGEIFSPNVRNIGTSISMTFGWTFGILSILSFGYIVESIGSFVIFWIYAIVNVISFIFTFYIVPETKGLTLADIQTRL